MDEQNTRQILAYLEGKLSDPEKEEFRKWLEAGKTNKEFYFRIRKIHYLLQPDGSFDVESSWTRLIPKLNRTTKFFYSLRHGWVGYVAVILITLLSTLSVSFFLFSESEFAGQPYVLSRMSGTESVILPDGSKIYIGPETSISYERDYGRKKRTVHLEGEAYFEVAASNTPFVVYLNEQSIEVLGTRFNVMAYPGDTLVITTLLEGSVCMHADNYKEDIFLLPDQQLVYHTLLKEMTITEVDAAQSIRWIDGYYSFDNETLENILKRMGKVYNKTFVLLSDTLKETQFAGTFYKQQNYKDILDVINITIPIHHYVKGDSIYVDVRP